MINLDKGQKIDLTKDNPSLKRVIVGLGWDKPKYDGQDSFDLDVSAVLVGANGRAACDEDFVFYKNLQDPNKAVTHSGDHLVGGGGGVNETVTIDFEKVPQSVERIAILITIHKAEQRNQKFGMVPNAFARVTDADTNTNLVNFDLGEDFSVETGIAVCELYRHNGEWKFNAIGQGYKKGLDAFLREYGLDGEYKN